MWMQRVRLQANLRPKLSRSSWASTSPSMTELRTLGISSSLSTQTKLPSREGSASKKCTVITLAGLEASLPLRSACNSQSVRVPWPLAARDCQMVHAEFDSDCGDDGRWRPCTTRSPRKSCGERLLVCSPKTRFGASASSCSVSSQALRSPDHLKLHARCLACVLC